MKLDNMLSGSVQGFGFSAVRPEILGATEYTLVTLVLDKTGSVASFSKDLFAIKQRVVEACRKSPRADYVLLRVVEFNSSVDEVHGFVPLPQVDASTYTEPVCSGSTALYDATYSSIGATRKYANTLADQEYLVNALVVVATDGEDNASRFRADDVKKEIAKVVGDEQLESLKTILVAVNAGGCGASLQRFASDAGIDEYVDVGDATPGKLAKLAAFVSQSISTTSQALGTGGPSQAIVF